MREVDGRRLVSRVKGGLVWIERYGGNAPKQPPLPVPPREAQLLADALGVSVVELR